MKNKSLYLLLSIFLLSIIIHLKGINSPLLDFHSWRQTQTAMIARNYYRNDFNFFNPKLDWYGQESNKRAGTEFPIFSFSIALLYKVFGYHDVLGRYLAIFFSAISSVYFFLLLKKYFNLWQSYISAIIFIVIPINIYFTRTIQPESLMLFSIIAGLYHFVNYLENTDTKIHFILSLVFLTIAVLVKLPSIYILLPIIYLSYQKWGNKVFKRIDIWLFNISLLICVGLWYAFTKSGKEVLPLNISDYLTMLSVIKKPNFWARLFFSRFIELTTTYTGLIFFIIGLCLVILKNRQFLFGIWLLSVIIYSIFIGEYGYIHQYTVLPFAPINAVFIGSGITYILGKYKNQKILRAFIILLVLTIPLHSILRISNWYKIEDKWLLKAKEDVEKISKENDLFLCNTGIIPLQLYHIDRKGFSVDIRKTNLKEINDIIKKNISFFLTVKDNRWPEDNEIRRFIIKNYSVVCEDKDYIIFDLRKH